MTLMPTFEALKARLEPAGQTHLLGFWPRLNEEQRFALAAQISALDLSSLFEMKQAIEMLHSQKPRELSPAPVVELAERRFPYLLGDDAEKARGAGAEALRLGKVACLLVAGGQGTRLGFPGPKGCYPLLPLSRMTLFEIFARKLKRVGTKHGKTPPLYVMVSRQNEGLTREFFAEHRYFGLDERGVHFFAQGELPSLDADGKLVLESPHALFLGPDGHGGVLQALTQSGGLAQLQRDGISTLSYFQVDNAQVPVADEAFLGLHLSRQADVSLKVVRKLDETERVGVFCLDRGIPQIVEYSEFSEAQSKLRDERGLVYWAGSIAVHAFSVAFLERLAASSTRLPLHAAHKKVPVLDARGELVTPHAPNVYRFERFIFDTLPLARHVVALEVPREEQFLPLKNPDGPFGPEGVRQALDHYWRQALAAGATAVTHDRPPQLEVDPLLAENARELAEVLASRRLSAQDLDRPLRLT